ncbi:hypothetical protein BDR26DRAFT_898729 [Obelidium mucronatum]|nr:hypothetical protein BDR26DRAFT_898729 [Obelidium mucronatum]
MIKTIGRWENKHGLKVEALRHDTAEIERTNAMQFYCDNKEPQIKTHPSPPYSKEFNGKSESMVNMVKSTTAVIMKRSRLPKSMTKYVIRYVVHINNRLINSRTKETPYLRWNHQPPNISNLRPFGSYCTIWLDKAQRKGKYGSKGVPGIFLGYVGDTIILVFNLFTRTVHPVFHVEFTHTNYYPGLTKDLDNIEEVMEKNNPEVQIPPAVDFSDYWTEEEKEAIISKNASKNKRKVKGEENKDKYSSEEEEEEKELPLSQRLRKRPQPENTSGFEGRKPNSKKSKTTKPVNSQPIEKTPPLDLRGGEIELEPNSKKSKATKPVNSQPIEKTPPLDLRGGEIELEELTNHMPTLLDSDSDEDELDKFNSERTRRRNH